VRLDVRQYPRQVADDQASSMPPVSAPAPAVVAEFSDSQFPALVEPPMDPPETTVSSTDNERLFQDVKNPGFLASLWRFLMASQKWWLLPPLLLLLLLGALLALSQTAAAPFIYTLF